MLVGLRCLCFVAAAPQRLFNELRGRPDMLEHLRADQPDLVRAIENNDMSMIEFLS